MHFIKSQTCLFVFIIEELRIQRQNLQHAMQQQQQQQQQQPRMTTSESLGGGLGDTTSVWTYDQPHLSTPSLVQILQEEKKKEKVK